MTRDAEQALREIAAVHKLTVSQVAADILDRSLHERAETAGLGLLGPAVEAVIKREVGRMSDRLAHLMARTALEAATTRRLVFQLLVRELGLEEAKHINQAAWTASVDGLRKPAEGLNELLGAHDGAR